MGALASSGAVVSWPPPPTAHDIGAARVTFLDVMHEVITDAYDGPETVVLSLGYANVCEDGEVTVRGRVWFVVDEDGLVEDAD